LTYERLKADGLFPIDIITGGYPCQPFSLAGRKKGEEDPRHLWPEYFRLVKELRPTWVIGENVSGHIKLGLDTVLENLESEGYSTRTFSISASSVGANHQRERVWIVANARQHGRRIESTRNKESIGRGSSKETEWSTNTNQITGSSERTKTMANTKGLAGDEREFRNSREESYEKRISRGKIRGKNSDLADSSSSRGQVGLSKERHREERHAEKFDNESNRQRGWQREDNWAIEPNVGRVAHGIPNRVDRLKCLGNSLIPQIPYYIGSVILRIKND
jgi:DNA (cytosine-5)-methyltransferase 1